MSSLFVVLLEYVVPLEEVDAVLPEHSRFLEDHYRTGMFLLSGRRIPRSGGVILARAASVEALMDVLATDPFSMRGVARYTPVEFSPTMAAPALQELLG